MADKLGLHELGATAEETDSKQLDPGFGDGGVPWYLLAFYLAFLVFFTWYVLEYQLPDFAERGSAHADRQAVEEPADAE